MKTTWDEIIASNISYIDLIWYGSILNANSHEWETTEPDTVIVKWFRRIYNLKMVPDSIDDTTLEAFRKKYWEKYWVKNIIQVRKLWKEKVCVLNCKYTGFSGDKVNGVVIRIKRKDFETYKKREAIYNLYTTRYHYLDPENGKITHNSHSWYILSAQEKYIIDDWHAFLPYHNFSRDGAYNFWEYFGNMFDETTYKIKSQN